MNPAYLSPVADHLWQSSLFAGVAGLFTLALRNNCARVRHWVWLAASWKFLIPFSLLMSLGGQFHWRSAPQTTQSPVSVLIESVSRPFTAPAASTMETAAALPAPRNVPAALWTIWACGFLGISGSWWIRWRRIRAAVRAGSPLHLPIPVRALSSPTLLEPGVFGVFRPLILLPEGIFHRLTVPQLKGVIAHELCHVHHRDNVIAAIHMFVETLFWFHPLVWWIGRRMVEERERACDEEVIRLGSEPRAYAEGILNVCRLYMESPLVCVAGITGAGLKRRIEGIMANRAVPGLNRTKKILLAGAGVGALAGPIAIGLVCSTPTSAQAPSPPAFEVASVKPAKSGTREFHFFARNNGIDAVNIPLEAFILRAYNLKDAQLAGAPDWIRNEHYDIVAKAPSNSTNAGMRAMLQTLLADRFKLVTHRETRVLPVVALVVARRGPKFGVVKETRPGDGDFKIGRGRLSGQAVTMQELADMLVGQIDRIVIDKTGLAGKFDINLEWAPEVVSAPLDDRETTPDPGGPSLSAALSEQLGLRLEAAKAPVPIVVIDHVEKPAAN